MAILKLPRRTFLHLVAGAAVLPAVPRLARAQAQAYPSRPVRIVVGFPPAGSTDITARLIGQWLSERLGQQFVIENRPGAGSSLATETVAKAAPDGYTLLLTNSGDAWNATIYSNLRYNYIRDIVPVASISRGMGALVVNPAVPVMSVPELIAYAKANPGKVTVASAGVGSGPHMYWELFRSMTGVNMLHVPYRGGGPALTDVVPGYDASGWFGIGAPKNTPVEIVDKLHKEINAGLADPGLKTRFAELGDAVFATSPAAFGKFIADETEKWGKVIRAANIKSD